MTFWDWLLSLSRVFSGFMRVLARIRASVLPVVKAGESEPLAHALNIACSPAVGLLAPSLRLGEKPSDPAACSPVRAPPPSAPAVSSDPD